MGLNFKGYFVPRYEAAKIKSEELINRALRSYIECTEVQKCTPVFYSEAKNVLCFGSSREKERFIASTVVGASETPFSVDYNAKDALDFRASLEQFRLAIMRVDENSCYAAMRSMEQIAKF